MDKIIKLIQNLNIGAGQTEIVLSTIFMILCKMLVPYEEAGKQNKAEEATQNRFKTQFSLQAITEGMKILRLNQKREVDEEEL